MEERGYERSSDGGKVFKVVLMDDNQSGFGELHHICPECTEKAEGQIELLPH